MRYITEPIPKKQYLLNLHFATFKKLAEIARREKKSIRELIETALNKYYYLEEQQ